MADTIPGYRFIKPIGTGAGSRIWLATELATNRSFAVKQIVRNSSKCDRFIQQAENEFEVTHLLDHPCLRKSFSLHRVRKLLQTRELYLVMEFVEGLPLQTARPNRLDTFFAIFRKVAQGLAALHEAGYVHADIKPINILMARGGGVKIIDFGQACRMGHKKERVQGTPDYIAPEQVRRLRLDRRTDVFNLGATMYWVLTSETFPTVIRGTGARGGISLTSADRPLAPIELNDKLPLALSRLVMECCSEKPDDRPADMKQVMARLDFIQNRWRQQRENTRAEATGDPTRGASPAAEPQGAAGENRAKSDGGETNLNFNERTVRSVEEDG